MDHNLNPDPASEPLQGSAVPSRRAFLGTVIGGIGLAVVTGCTPSQPRGGTRPRPHPPGHRPRYFPSATAWETVSASAIGWDSARLDAVSAFAKSRATNALTMLVGGRILVEKYFGVSPDFRREVASCQKSVIAVLVGIATEKSLVRLDDRVSDHLGRGWTNATTSEEDRITLRHLITMTSGLDGRLRAVATPGETWSYNNDAYHQVQRVLEAVTATDINTLCTEWLWTPIGATASTWYPRPTGFPQSVDALGNPIWGLRMSARDMARFGLLIQRDARWERSRLLRPQYRRAALTSSSTMNPSYGYLWWLNGQDGYRIPSSSGLQAESLIPNAPDDLVAALGKDDQKIYVSRSTDLVVIRQGAPAGSRGAESLSDFDNELWRMIMAARPAR